MMFCINQKVTDSRFQPKKLLKIVVWVCCPRIDNTYLTKCVVFYRIIGWSYLTSPAKRLSAVEHNVGRFLLTCLSSVYMSLSLCRLIGARAIDGQPFRLDVGRFQPELQVFLESGILANLVGIILEESQTYLARHIRQRISLLTMRVRQHVAEVWVDKALFLGLNSKRLQIFSGHR